MSNKSKRDRKVSAAELPKQVVRHHLQWLRTGRRAVEALIRTTWQSPVEESAMLRDREAATANPETRDGRAWLLAESARHCELLAAMALDHALALEKSIAGRPLPYYAPMTLARSVLEAVVQFCYLTDCDIDTDLRLIRGSALLLGSARDEEAAVRGMRASVLPRGTLETVASMRANVEAWIAAAGIGIQQVGKSKRVVLTSPRGSSVNLSINVTDELPKYIPDVESAYRVGSGAAHGRRWMLHDPADEPGGVYVACGAVDLTFAALSALAIRSARYAGHDASALSASLLDRRRDSGRQLAGLMTAGFSSLGRYANEPRLTGPKSAP